MSNYKIFKINGQGKGTLTDVPPEDIVEIGSNLSSGSSDGGVITEDSDTVSFTGNGTAGNPLSAKGYNGSYSTTEALTGGTWIDGKPIYRKTIISTGNSVDSINTIDLLGLNIHSLLPNINAQVSLDGSSFSTSSKTTNYSNDGNTLKYARVKRNNNSVDSLNHNLLLNYEDNTSYVLFLNIEYTKTTDVAP